MDGAFDALGRKHQFNLGFSHSIIKAWNQSWDTSDQAGYPIPDVKDWTGDWPAPRWDILALSQTHRDEQTGIYGTLRLQLADRLHLLAGARWTRWQSSETSGGVAGYTHTYSEVTPYLGATYDLDDTYTAYASYTNIFLPQMVKTRSWDMAGPAYGHNYEAGIKAAYLDGRLNASLAVFQTDQKDVAEYGGFDPVHDDGWYYILEGTRTRGFEAELAGEVTPGWNVFLGYTYRQSKDNEGRKVQTTQPEQLLKASTAYRLPRQLEQADRRWRRALAESHQRADLLRSAGGRHRAEALCLVRLDGAVRLQRQDPAAVEYPQSGRQVLPVHGLLQLRVLRRRQDRDADAQPALLACPAFRRASRWPG